MDPETQEPRSPHGLCSETWVKLCLVRGSSEVLQRSDSLLNLPPPPPQFGLGDSFKLQMWTQGSQN